MTRIPSNPPPLAPPARTESSTAPASERATPAEARPAGWSPKAASAAPASQVGEVRGGQAWIKVSGEVSFTVDGNGRTGSAERDRDPGPGGAIPITARSAPPWGGVDVHLQVVDDKLVVDLPNSTLSGWQQAPGHLEINLADGQRFFLTVKPTGAIRTNDSAVRAVELRESIAASDQLIAQTKARLQQFDHMLSVPVESARYVVEAKAGVEACLVQLEVARSKVAERERLSAMDAPTDIFLMARDVAQLSSETAKFVELGRQRSQLAAQLAPIAELSDAGLGSDPTQVARLREQEGAAVTQQRALADAMRRRILDEPALLSQVNPSAVVNAESALRSARSLLTHAERVEVEDIQSRQVSVGQEQAQAKASIAEHTERRAAAEKALAQLASNPSFSDVPLR